MMVSALSATRGWMRSPPSRRGWYGFNRSPSILNVYYTVPMHDVDEEARRAILSKSRHEEGLHPQVFRPARSPHRCAPVIRRFAAVELLFDPPNAA